MLSQSPYRELAKDLGDKPVVISGRGAPEVAQAYGFTRAVTTSQLSARYPEAVPFCHDPGALLRLARHICSYLHVLHWVTLHVLLYTACPFGQITDKPLSLLWLHVALHRGESDL